ncbi:MAG: thiol protease/hemagglutinin PrtT [Paludibacteraceae bacterium]|nr:thiol protease/hemagglutinin PrtT [Paludibacteraceae bacterium]
MKKLIIICAIAIVGHHAVTAQSVSKVLATRTAMQYAKYSGCETAPAVLKHANVSRLSVPDTTITRSISPTGKAQLYLVEPEDGWVLVSSELATTPILASSATGRFPSEENMPDGMKWLLAYYEDVIQYARDSIPEKRTNDKWSSYTPSLLKQNHPRTSNPLSRMAQVLWKQRYNSAPGITSHCDKTYNKFCPIGVHPADHCGHQPVGCDAVALGQLMWYYQWPHSALIPNAPNSIGGPKHLVEYDWNAIPAGIYDYSDTTDVNSVASFLRDCGYANNTIYGDSSSSSNLAYNLYALIMTFHYKSGIQLLYRKKTSNWIGKLKDEIDAGRPVIYRGEGYQGGHAFILYGYDADDKFYVNWGYGGDVSNSVSYSLNALSLILYGQVVSFNDEQIALFNVEPDYHGCETYSLASTDIVLNKFEVYNGGPIIAQDKTIHSHKTGVLYSGQSITLLPPFTIEYGANVHLAIRDINCDLSQQNAPRKLYATPLNGEVTNDDALSLRKETFTLSPNPVNAILHIQTTEELAQVKIYNLNGQCVLQADQTDIDVSALPQGMYILRACAVDGAALSAKFIKD